MTREVSEAGLDIIRRAEGLRLEAYLCPAGKLTIGYGHTATTSVGQVIDQNGAEALLRLDVRRAARQIEELVKVPLTNSQFAALASLVFNIGEGAFARSTLLRKLNAGDYAAVPAELRRWIRSHGVILKGLVKRRAAEAELWGKVE